MKTTKKRLLEIIKEELQKDREEETKVDLPIGILERFNTLRDDLGDEKLLVQIVKVIPENLMIKVLDKISSSSFEKRE